VLQLLHIRTASTQNSQTKFGKLPDTVSVLVAVDLYRLMMHSQ
jgi:hypothetical protein